MTDDQTLGSFPELIALTAPALRPLCEALRERIRALDPEVTERVWPRQRIVSWGTGPRKMSDHFAYAAPFRAHVNLGFYRGVDLPDPRHRLEGNGKALRHIKLRSLEALDDPVVIALLRAAIAERRAAAAVRGSLDALP